MAVSMASTRIWAVPVPLTNLPKSKLKSMWVLALVSNLCSGTPSGAALPSEDDALRPVRAPFAAGGGGHAGVAGEVPAAEGFGGVLEGAIFEGVVAWRLATLKAAAAKANMRISSTTSLCRRAQPAGCDRVWSSLSRPLHIRHIGAPPLHITVW